MLPEKNSAKAHHSHHIYIINKIINFSQQMVIKIFLLWSKISIKIYLFYKKKKT